MFCDLLSEIWYWSHTGEYLKIISTDGNLKSSVFLKWHYKIKDNNIFKRDIKGE